MANLQELKNIENRLLKQLESILTNLSAVRKTKALLEGGSEENDSGAEEKHSKKDSSDFLKKGKKVKKLSTTPRKAPTFSKEQLEGIVNEVEHFFRGNGNKPSSIKEIKSHFDLIGFKIPVSNPGATLAAILRGNKKFSMINKENRLWGVA